MGRDERLKQQQIQGAIADLRAGEAIAVDRLSRRMAVGDLVTVAFPVAPLYRIEEISHELDPRAPAGMVRVVLTAAIPFHVTQGMPTGEVLLVHRPTTDERRA